MKDNLKDIEFEVNNNKWCIQEVPSKALINMYTDDRGNTDNVYYIFGLTNKSDHIIYVNQEMCKDQKVKTLKHELTHCYIWNHGLYNVPSYNEEMVCDLVSSITDFINKVVRIYEESLLDNELD